MSGVADLSSKYDPLSAFLTAQYGDQVPMTFAEIERVLGVALPPSARKHRPWWSNNADNSAMTRVWLKAGFRTAQVDLAAERVVFIWAKEAAEPAHSGLAEAETSGAPDHTVATRHPAIGAMKGMITVMPGVDLTDPVDPEWVERLYDDKATTGDLVGGLDDPVPDRR